MEETEIYENNPQDNSVDIKPLKKGKRVLIFLADFFLNLIITFFLFSIAVAPIGKAITGFNSKNEEHQTVASEMYNFYYESGVLLKNTEFEAYDLTAGIEYTYRCFLSYYVLDSEESINPSYPQYGHKDLNDTIRHFYRDIRGDESAYKTLFEKYNKENEYFTFDTEFKLKTEVKNELYAFFDVKDEMGDIGNGYYKNIQNNVFNPMIAEVFSDMINNDLVLPDHQHTFNECKAILASLEKYHENLMTSCTFIAYAISSLVYYLVIPFFNMDKKTLGMMMMKVERVVFTNLNHPSRIHQLLIVFYSLLTNMIGLVLIPAILVPFNNLFANSWLLYSSIFSLALSLVSLIFVLFNQYNRSFTDFLSNTLYLAQDDMDALYRARGYNV